MPRIFISYRRSSTLHVAGRLRNDLVRHFGEEQIFRDVDSNEGGQDWPGKIMFDRTWDEGKPTQVAFTGLARKQESWFQLEKKGSSFTGSFSLDGKRFERIGQQCLVGAGDARLELVAYDTSPGIETGVEFDVVEITP